ncbi:MAG TPA: RDD family protein [Candidatus Saccharimonadales bacterium]|nr:RDD family protein [Candidatus Saccharimonadales bacterium]
MSERTTKKIKRIDLSISDKKIKGQKKIASRDQRITNSLLDSIPILLIIYLITGTVNNTSLQYNVTYGIILFFYYFIFELIFSKTPAKFLTKTKVVLKNGNKLTYKIIFLRTIIRLIPFEGITFLFSHHPVGLHDKVSGTLVIDENIDVTRPWLDKTEKILKIIFYIFLALLLILFLLLIIFGIKSKITGTF